MNKYIAVTNKGIKRLSTSKDSKGALAMLRAAGYQVKVMVMA